MHICGRYLACLIVFNGACEGWALQSKNVTQHTTILLKVGFKVGLQLWLHRGNGA